jgi:transposase
MINLHFSNQDITDLHENRFKYPHPRIQLRFEVLYLKAMGLSHSDICRLCKITRATLVKYLKMYLNGGIDSLKQWNYHGKVNSLSDHTSTIEEYFRSNPPLSSKQAASVIEKLTGISRSITQIKEFLHSIGMKFRKIGSVPKGVDTEEKQREQDLFLKKTSNPTYVQQKLEKGWYFF